MYDSIAEDGRGRHLIQSSAALAYVGLTSLNEPCSILRGFHTSVSGSSLLMARQQQTQLLP